jgi:hypothetical protein
MVGVGGWGRGGSTAQIIFKLGIKQDEWSASNSGHFTAVERATDTL